MKKGFLLAVMMMVSTLVTAQKREISGILIDGGSKEAVPMVTVQLLKPDSTFVVGAVSDSNGRFAVQAPANEKYLLKVSSIGYVTLFRPVEIRQGHNLNLGNVTIRQDAVMLKEALVTAQAMKVTLKEDTFVYNSSAYRTPEGSVVEELVKRLPGAQISEDGKITINGKEVKKILVDGKEFMTGDTQTALKNIPTSVIDKIKAYDQKSDLSRVTGIDDGNEETVLDFGVKPGMNKGLMANADVGIGTENRYSTRAFGGYFNNRMRVFGMGNANNVNDMGFGGRGGFFGGGRNGLNAAKMAGFNLNYEKKDTLKIDGSVRWNHRNGDVYSRTSAENFVSRSGSFSNSRSQNYTRSDSWHAQARIEWTPDSMTNILFRPTASFSTNDGLSNSRSASYNADPYLYVDDPLSDGSMNRLDEEGLIVNSGMSNGMTYSESKNVGVMAQFNRRLNSRGRNFTFRVDANYGDGESRSLTRNNVHLYQIKDIHGTDSAYQTSRYALTPSKNWGYTLQTTYSEPLWKATFLQLRYQFTYRYSKSDRSTYDFSNLGAGFFDGVNGGYRSWNNYLDRLSEPYEHYLDTDLSRFSEYKTYQHDLELMFRMIRKQYQLNAGVLMRPMQTRYVQHYQGVYVDTLRSVFNMAPTFDFRYRFSKVSNLRVNYRAETVQPGMDQLLDIYDDSDPLNISTGNPGLKPAFTQRFRLFYNNYSEATQRSLMTHLSFATTSNSISNKVTYDEATGGRLMRPENISGNWNMNGVFMFNTPLDSAGCWNVSTFTHLSYANNVGYVSLNRLSDSQKNTTKDLTLGERLSASYRSGWLEVEADGSLSYRHSRNNLQRTANMDTWQFGYGVNLNVQAPWGTTLATDLHMNSRRGYNDQMLNTNELVWNAQISHSFLKGRPLTLMLQFYDILHNQSNLSRSLTAMQRSDTEYNSINSYVMLRANYRLNLFGTKNARAGMHGPGMRPGGGRPGAGGFGGIRRIGDAHF